MEVDSVDQNTPASCRNNLHHLHGAVNYYIERQRDHQSSGLMIGFQVRHPRELAEEAYVLSSKSFMDNLNDTEHH